MRKNTKNRIIETGAEIIHLRGFNNTGIQEILDAAGVPKGSFYNYFRNKEEFGLQVIDYFGEQFPRMIKGILDDDSLSPLNTLRGILEWFMEFFKSKDYAYGCPIGNLSQEMGDLSPAFREKLKTAMDVMVEIYAKILTKALATGEISAELNPHETACFIVSSWEGALVHMKITKSPEPLEKHMKFIFDHILRP